MEDGERPRIEISNMAMATKNLLSVFRSKGISDDELPEFLNSHFRSSGHRSETNEVFYPNDASPAVVLVYRSGRLLEVRAESGLSEGGIAKLCDIIYRDNIGTSETGFQREILFSGAKVQGTWRHRNLFQILPVPPTAPQPPFSYAEHPFLIEYSYAKTSNGHTSSARSARALRRLELLLNCLVLPSIRSERFPSGGRTHRWVLERGSSETDLLSCSYRQLGYYWKDPRPGIEDLSKATGIKEIPLVSAPKYYVDYPPTSEPLTLPDDLSESIDCFLGLETDKQQRFLQACFWFRQADQSPSMSTSFINLIQAIETLLPRAQVEGQCSVCKREFKPGPTKLFKMFMEEYAPISSGNDEVRQKLYSIRSGLAHGNAAPFLADMNQDGSLNPLGIQEMEYLSAARQAVRIAMRNWLQPRRAKLWDKRTETSDYFSAVAFSGEQIVVRGNEARTSKRNERECLLNGITRLLSRRLNKGGLRYRADKTYNRIVAHPEHGYWWLTLLRNRCAPFSIRRQPSPAQSAELPVKGARVNCVEFHKCQPSWQLGHT